MKKTVIILIALIFSISINAQEKMYIYKTDNTTLGAPVSATDSIYFSSDKTRIYFHVGGSLVDYPLSHVDSLAFGPNSDTVFIAYHDYYVSVFNPLAFEGVTVTVNGADVIATHTSETRDINYCLTGYTSNGSFKIYSEKRYNLLLNSVDITNTDGPAINSQSTNKASVVLMDGTSNRLTDGSAYATAPNNSEGEEEDQKAAFFSEGAIVFKGTGSLTINGTGTDKHAVGSDDEIEIEGGNITITGANNDGIHGKDGFSMTNGTLNITADGDGIDGDEGYITITGGAIGITCAKDDVNGIKCDSNLTVSGAVINMTINGNQSKGFNCNQDLAFSGGTITINTTGGVALNADGSGYDPSYCSGIKADGNILINGADITITSTGIAGKGISGDKDFTITDGKLKITTSGKGATYKNSSGLTDVYQSTCISTDGSINLTGGSVTTSSSGIAGRGLNCDVALTIGSTSSTPVVSVTTTGTSLNVSGNDKAEAKAIKCDGAVTINSGEITVTSADDGIKSLASITINNGNVSLTKSIEGMEAPNITVNGGNVSIVSSDDSFNATNGNGSEQDDNSQLNLNGGYIVLNATTGDPIDSNGDLTITGGIILVHGPQSQPEVAMDVNGSKIISGGFIVASGSSSNMTEGFDQNSSQYSVLIKTQQQGGGPGGGGTTISGLFHIQDANGNDIVTFKPARNFSSILFSSPTLVNGTTYSIYTGGSSTGTLKDGLYSGGTYSGGTLKKSFTVSGKVTNVTW